MPAEFRYEWSRSNADGRGKVDCDNPMVRAMLSQQLRIVLGFVQSWRDEFAGCELACTTEDGKRVIRVVGPNDVSKSGISSLVLNDDGMPVELHARLVARGRGGKTMFVRNSSSQTRLVYVILDGRHAITRMASVIETGGSKLEITTSCEFIRSGDGYVCSRLMNTFKNLGSVGPPNSTMTVDLYDYEFAKIVPAEARKN